MYLKKPEGLSTCKVNILYQENSSALKRRKTEFLFQLSPSYDRPSTYTKAGADTGGVVSMKFIP